MSVAADRPIMANSFAFTSPYDSCWLEHFYRRGATDLFREKVKTEQHFRHLIAASTSLPELMILGNFIVERHAIQFLCRQLKIDSVCSEDGFFPHYETIHADPLGFAWESSLPRMIFRGVTDHQRHVAQTKRSAWLRFDRSKLPSGIRKPFVLWPLQLIGDKVNQLDLQVTDWSEMIVHFRKSLPPEYQLVIKPHPRGKECDRPKQPISALANTLVLKRPCDLRSLIEASSAVAGANSTVLMETRLMFHKPTYAYGRSWFTNHTELVFPIAFDVAPRELNHLDFVAKDGSMRNGRLDDYTDWFLYQLLARQLDRESAANWETLRQWTARHTYRSFIAHGEDIFQ